MSESNIITRSYVDNFSFKEMVINQLGPKYFPDIPLNKLNIGLQGLVLETIGNAIEDTFNTQSTLIKEAWVNRAQMPDSIYSHAAIFQLDNLFSVPARCKFALIIKGTDISNFGEVVYDGSKAFHELKIDSRTTLSVEDLLFTLDYDISIKGQYNSTLEKWIYSTQYILSEKNSISSITHQMIQHKVLPNGDIVLFIEAHQCEKHYRYDNIINNTKVNFPVIEFTHDDLLCGFDVFYREPGSDSWEQLKTLLVNSAPIKTPFCYYKIMDRDKFVISFTPREGFFQPKFNSEIMVKIYTTLGSKGVFKAYTGNNLAVIPNSEKYTNNAEITLMCLPIDGAVDGRDSLGLDGLQSISAEAYSTAKAITTENDLNMYFNNFKYRFGTDVFFMKKRHDLVNTLYSAFCIFKDDDFIYSTNTLNIKMDALDITENLRDTDKHYIIEPGRRWVYDSSKDTVIPVKDSDVIAPGTIEYINPFMMSLTRSPQLCGYYLTAMNTSVNTMVEYTNHSTMLQFLLTSIKIEREMSKSEYDISIKAMTSVEVEEPIITDFVNLSNNECRVVCGFTRGTNVVGFLELVPTLVDEDNHTYSFKGTLKTIDRFNSEGYFATTNLNKINETGDYMYIPMIDAEVKIYFLKKDDDWDNPFYTTDASFTGYGVNGIYNNKEDLITFIRPMNMMRSLTKIGDGRTEVTDPIILQIFDVPLIRSSILQNTNKFNTFMTTLTSQYVYMSEVLTVLKNNASVDMKFYNTYGKSKNFTIGDEGEPLDKVNLTVKFKLDLVEGTSKSIIESIKLFIKRTIESINAKGSNDIYVSNIIRLIENNFAEVRSLKFIGFNDYSSDYQRITSKRQDLIMAVDKSQMIHYVPEFLVVDVDDIHITLY